MSRLTCLKPKLAPSTIRGWKPDSQRGSRHERGYGGKWEKMRERILHRDCGLCQPHLRQGNVVQATQVDHIVSKAEARARGWTEAQIEDESNLQAICIECHKAKTAAESRRGAG